MLGKFVLFVGSFLCVGGLFLVSTRFLHTLIALEQLNVLLLVSRLMVSGGDFTFFVSFLVMFTMEAVVALVVLTRV